MGRAMSMLAVLLALALLTSSEGIDDQVSSSVRMKTSPFSVAGTSGLF